MLFTDSLPASWEIALAAEWQKPYMQTLQSFLTEEAQNATILPPMSERFNAFKIELSQIKIVILGQDPYPTRGHAHGLAFSVLPSVKPLPRSLVNIFKELYDDLGIDNRHTGYLQPWAEQGVFLLNTVLTVREGAAGSHQKRGWEQFTDAVIQLINAQPTPIAFVLWGSQAQKKASMIDAQRHLILKAAHPSPLSVRKGFLGSRPFSQINAWLDNQGRNPIQWQLPMQPTV